jgi:hypothetical protein
MREMWKTIKEFFGYGTKPLPRCGGCGGVLGVPHEFTKRFANSDSGTFTTVTYACFHDGSKPMEVSRRTLNSNPVPVEVPTEPEKVMDFTRKEVRENNITPKEAEVIVLAAEKKKKRPTAKRGPSAKNELKPKR